jgi:hypothetical protein
MLFKETVTVRNIHRVGRKIYRDPVRTSQETHYATDTERTRLILFGKVAVYCEDYWNTRKTVWYGSFFDAKGSSFKYQAVSESHGLKPRNVLRSRSYFDSR